MADDNILKKSADKFNLNLDGKWQNLRLTISEDRMKVLLQCTSFDIEQNDIGNEVVSRLQAMGIKTIPEPIEIIQMIADNYTEGAEAAEILLVEGSYPVQPTDAGIEWKGNFFTPGYAIDPVTKKIDFRQKASEPTVEQDQVLVVVHPAIEGKEGLDVKGKKISVRTPRKHSLKNGKNVYWNEDDNTFRAKTEGRVRLSGNILDVDEVITVNGDVGIVSGNIDHRGQIQVRGDVESESKISATGDIDVQGVILAADVNCGGNLVAVDGINSSTDKKIDVKGDIIAKYILNGNVVCEGNITANREIYQCYIKSRGEVVCGSGRIIGGEIMSALAIEAEEVGSKAETKTKLIVGIDYAKYDKLNKLRDRIKEIEDAAKILNSAKRKLEQMKMILDPKQKKKLVELTIELNDYLTYQKEKEDEAQEIHREMVMDRSAYIRVSGIVFPGVVFRLYDSSYVVQRMMRGPIIAKIDPGTLQIKVTQGGK